MPGPGGQGFRPVARTLGGPQHSPWYFARSPARWSQELFSIYIIFQASCHFFMSSRSRFRFKQKRPLFFTLPKRRELWQTTNGGMFSLEQKAPWLLSLLLWRGYPWYNLVQVYGMWVWERIGDHTAPCEPGEKSQHCEHSSLYKWSVELIWLGPG